MRRGRRGSPTAAFRLSDLASTPSHHHVPPSTISFPCRRRERTMPLRPELRSAPATASEIRLQPRRDPRRRFVIVPLILRCVCSGSATPGLQLQGGAQLPGWGAWSRRSSGNRRDGRGTGSGRRSGQGLGGTPTSRLQRRLRLPRLLHLPRRPHGTPRRQGGAGPIRPTRPQGHHGPRRTEHTARPLPATWVPSPDFQGE